MYNLGRGAAQDFAEGVKWSRLAAEQGLAGAQASLGGAYHEGHGLTQNYTEAAKWYRLAADQADAAAQSNLGLMYADGQGVPQNDAEAFEVIGRPRTKVTLTARSIWVGQRTAAVGAYSRTKLRR